MVSLTAPSFGIFNAEAQRVLLPCRDGDDEYVLYYTRPATPMSQRMKQNPVHPSHRPSWRLAP